MTLVPLSPLGAVRRRFSGDATDAFFRSLGVGAARCDLGDQGLYLAEELVQWNSWLGEEDRRAFAVFVLALLLANRQGSTRLELDPRGSGAVLVGDVLRAAGLERELDAKKVLARIARLSSGFDRVIGAPPTGDEAQPLLLDDGAVYSHRLWWLEDRLARQLAPRLGARALSCTAEEAAEVAAAAGAAARLSDEQIAAVAAAVGFQLSVITGGPGTGKTATLAAIVDALLRRGLEPVEIALAAPTGKAAFRMSESLLARATAAAGSATAGMTSVPAAQTIHRLLGFQPGGGFRHGEANPVPARAVIVDESSMLDLTLTERLVRALPADCRLVLIGDPHQLPSVDAGQVLADLVTVAGGTAAGGDAPWFARLTRSFRMDAGTSGGGKILRAAAAVQAGEARKLITIGAQLGQARSRPEHVAGVGVELLDVSATDALGLVDHWWRGRHVEIGALAAQSHHRRGGVWTPEAREALDELLARHEASRLLAVTRGGDTGTRALNARCHAHMLAGLLSFGLEGAPELVPGEPVLFTRNDYDRGLFNGDQGVIARVIDDGGEQRWRAVFRRAGELVPFSIDALRGGLEPAWAMTVHKSQGSELDQIALVLPTEDSPLLTRELLYTALTRARTSAVIVGRKDLIPAAGNRTAARSSGLAMRLRRHSMPT